MVRRVRHRCHQPTAPSPLGVRVLQPQPGERGPVRCGLPGASASVLCPKARFAGDLPPPLSPLRGALVRAAVHRPLVCPKHTRSLSYTSACNLYHRILHVYPSLVQRWHSDRRILFAGVRRTAVVNASVAYISDFFLGLSSGLRANTGGLGSAPHSVPGGPPAADQHPPVERIHQPPGLLHHVRRASPHLNSLRDSSFLAAV